MKLMFFGLLCLAKVAMSYGQWVEDLERASAFYSGLSQAAADLYPRTQAEHISNCTTAWNTYQTARANFPCVSDPFNSTWNCGTLDMSAQASAKMCCRDEDGTNAWFAGDDEHCKSYINQHPTPVDQDCCHVCATPSDPMYATTCTKENAVEISLCGIEDTNVSRTSNGTVYYHPLPEGWECDATGFGVEGKYEVCVDEHCNTEQTFYGPDCGQFDEDLANNRSAAEIINAVFAENATEYYGKLRKSYGFLNRAVITGGGGLWINPTANCMFFMNGYLNGLLYVHHDDWNDNRTQNTLDLRIFNPTVDIDAPASMIMGGDVSVYEGQSHGRMNFSTHGKVKVIGFNNYGAVDFAHSSGIYIARTHNNGGNITFCNTTAYLYDIYNNAGHITFTSSNINIRGAANSGSIIVHSGSISLTDAANTGEITVNSGSVTLNKTSNAGVITVNDGEFILEDGLVNSATIRILGGSFKAGGTGLENIGNVTIEAGVLDVTVKSNTGSITIKPGVTGIIAFAAGGSVGNFVNHATDLLVLGISGMPTASPVTQAPITLIPSTQNVTDKESTGLEFCTVVQNKPCLWPLTYDNVIYNGSVCPVQSETFGGSWCATEFDENNEYSAWGLCTECSGAPSVALFTIVFFFVLF